MIIYNHVVNQCEDQKLILSQIFNTPIYKPNYSCIDFHAFQDFGVTLGKVILRSYSIEVIWGHLESIIPAHLRNYWYYRVFRGHMGSKFQAEVDSRSFELSIRAGVDSRSLQVNDENNCPVAFFWGFVVKLISRMNVSGTFLNVRGIFLNF